MAPGDLSFDDAVRLHGQGRIAEAERGYQYILEADPTHLGALHMLGLVRHQQGLHAAALGLIGRAIALTEPTPERAAKGPPQAVYHNNYGAVLMALGRHGEARTHFQRALDIRPEYPDALANLAWVQELSGQPEAALESLRRALKLQPDHRDALTRLADLLIACGQAEQAILYYTAALTADPKHAPAHFNLGTAYEDLYRTDEARRHFDQAAQLRPDRPFWAFRSAACCPAVFGSTAELDRYREELGHALDACISRRPASPDWNDLTEAGLYPTFALAYHGRNNRTLKEKFAAIYEPYFRDRPPAEGSGLRDRRRLGVVVTHRHEGMFLRAARPIIERLSSEKFEIVVLCSAEAVETIRRGIIRSDIRVVPFPRSLVDAAATIRAAACDLLYYWEVCSDAMNYFLPLARLAPRQCTSHGSQITTGMTAIDGFLSSDLVEPPDGEAHYTERLWRARSMFIYQDRLPAIEPGSAARFGLPEDRRLYLCFQAPLKIHPDMDAILGGILERDRQGLVVLLAGRHPCVAEQLRRRFAATIPAVADRIVFLSWQERDNYRRLLQLADVVLDPLHFGTSSSAYDIISYNQPVVTLPGPLAVSRFVAAFHRLIGVEELIVSSPEAYAEKAVQVAIDGDYRESLRQRIAAGSDVVFNDPAVIREHERFFEEMMADNGTSVG